MRSKLIEFMDRNFIHDGLLREFIEKERWYAAAKEINTAIEKRRKEIKVLNELATKVMYEYTGGDNDILNDLTWKEEK